MELGVSTGIRNKVIVESESWLTKAINHPGGKIVEFWLDALSRIRAEAGESWDGIPSKFKSNFHKVLTETSYAAELGRVVLASQLHFLFALEADWTRENILPLLDWDTNLKQAQQAWHGFLSWGRWNEDLLSDLLPLYEKTFAHLSTDLGSSELRDHFSGHIASIAIYGSTNPVQDGWLGRFLKAVDSKERKNWAFHIRILLQDMQENIAQNLWERWLKEYWEQLRLIRSDQWGK